MITPLQFKTAFPSCPLSQAPLWFEALNLSVVKFEIYGTNAWLANIAHECNELNRLQENLNYTVQRMREVWPHRFPTIESARYYALNAERLGNQVYGGRNGNGSYVSGDGYRFRGRGPFMLTFADNYDAFGKAIGAPIREHPDMVLEPKTGALSAGWFWVTHGCDKATDFDSVCDLVNIGHKTEKVGDAQGFADRKIRFDRLQGITP